jgi:hypothetical protein
MTTTYDPSALEKLMCPLCGSVGSLHPITMGRRLHVGVISFLLNFGKTFECDRCSARFSTEQLMDQRRENA